MTAAWWEYVTDIAGESRQDIAAAAGVDPSQVSRWSSGDNPNAKAVVSFARHHGRPPIEALIASGYLVPSDVPGVVEVKRSRARLSNQELLAEIRALWLELKRRVPMEEARAQSPPTFSKTRPRANKPANS